MPLLGKIARRIVRAVAGDSFGVDGTRRTTVVVVDRVVIPEVGRIAELIVRGLIRNKTGHCNARRSFGITGLSYHTAKDIKLHRRERDQYRAARADHLRQAPSAAQNCDTARDLSLGV